MGSKLKNRIASTTGRKSKYQLILEAARQVGAQRVEFDSGKTVVVLSPGEDVVADGGGFRYDHEECDDDEGP
ncbi:MAG: hypothetical protein GXP04_12200 [Alphaproteobacteria bacterium]|nr:hypothetical protein [Alphaproteobacteria bacterium]